MVDKPFGFRRWRKRYEIKMYNHGSAGYPSFNEVLRDIRCVEGQTSTLLRRRSHRYLALRLFNLISEMLNTLDSTIQSARLVGTPPSIEPIAAAADSARIALNDARADAGKTAKSSAVAWYLLGLPLGALAGYAGIWLLWKFPVAVVENSVNVSRQLGLCLAFGAIGAIVSVMTRTTRRPNLDVDISQGRTLTMIAGGFRTIIRAVFGAVLYVLVHGGLLPLGIPSSSGNDVVLFFAGLAFVAGFSERWAQDTIVHSAPSLGIKGNNTEQA